MYIEVLELKGFKILFYTSSGVRTFPSSSNLYVLQFKI